mmetsp:Transcript_115910/g.308231  ORF Transcript_115910/g.308231 Transcript_115910/m.308231 type:complete len:217 (+) Transcript_115910:120-770(+)
MSKALLRPSEFLIWLDHRLCTLDGSIILDQCSSKEAALPRLWIKRSSLCEANSLRLRLRLRLRLGLGLGRARACNIRGPVAYLRLPVESKKSRWTLLHLLMPVPTVVEASAVDISFCAGRRSKQAPLALAELLRRRRRCWCWRRGALDIERASLHPVIEAQSWLAKRHRLIPQLAVVVASTVDVACGASRCRVDASPAIAEAGGHGRGRSRWFWLW